MLSCEQQKIVSYFKEAHASQTLRHAYIITGPAGIGKKTASRAIEMCFACHSGAACGECNGCKSARLGANPDIIRVSNGDKKVYEVAKIRELIKKIYEKPANGKYKLITIENAHLLGEICQNALLKAIEEPPPYAVFILLCDNILSILPTILSRVMVTELTGWKQSELEAVCPLGDDEKYLYSYCMGNVGALLSVCADAQFKEARDAAIEAFCSLLKPGEYSVYDACEVWLARKEQLNDMLSSLTLFLRDVIFFKNGQKSDIINKDKLKQTEAVSSRVTSAQSLAMTEIVGSAAALMGRNENLNMAVLSMFMRLKEELNG